MNTFHLGFQPQSATTLLLTCGVHGVGVRGGVAAEVTAALRNLREVGDVDGFRGVLGFCPMTHDGQHHFGRSVSDGDGFKPLSKFGPCWSEL